jgi:hypothetical protein
VVADQIPKALLPGAAAFYGVTPATKHLWEQAKREGREWYYIDNAYFHEHRGVYFRATKNRLQHDGFGASDGKRFAALELEIMPWRKPGKHIVLAPQSDEFMQVVAGRSAYRSWTDEALEVLRRHTKRELRVLAWNRDKGKWYSELPANLVDCFALVTYSSASAISALLAGVPALVTADDCIAERMCRRACECIEQPLRPDNRRAWAEVVADQQWTLDEMRSGLAWQMLHA